MKLKYIATLIGALALGLSTQSNATEHHTAQALEHSAMAAAHGQDGHADQLLKHA
ncbi:MAG: small metal-binding protein SmbP, partial [Methylobacter sp.]